MLDCIAMFQRWTLGKPARFSLQFGLQPVPGTCAYALVTFSIEVIDSTELDDGVGYLKNHREPGVKSFMAHHGLSLL